MLLPDLNELISLRSRVKGLKFSSGSSLKNRTPGDHLSSFKGQGLEFDSVREYAPGDDIRNIDWRVTARKGVPHMKLFREEKERSVFLFVDMNETMRFGTRKTFKSVQAAKTASLLGWRGLANHEKVGAGLFGDVLGGVQFFTPNRTRKSLWSMMKLLVEPPVPQNQVFLEEFLTRIEKGVQTGSLIFVISDFMEFYSASLEPVLSRLSKRCDLVFVSVNDPADKSLVPIGEVAFQSSHLQKLVVNTDSLAGREAYAAKWEENRQLLKTLASRLNIAIIELSTERDVSSDLLMSLRNNRWNNG